MAVQKRASRTCVTRGQYFLGLLIAALPHFSLSLSLSLSRSISICHFGPRPQSSSFSGRSIYRSLLWPPQLNLTLKQRVTSARYISTQMCKFITMRFCETRLPERCFHGTNRLEILHCLSKSTCQEILWIERPPMPPSYEGKRERGRRQR